MTKILTFYYRHSSYLEFFGFMLLMVVLCSYLLPDWLRSNGVFWVLLTHVVMCIWYMVALAKRRPQVYDFMVRLLLPGLNPTSFRYRKDDLD